MNSLWREYCMGGTVVYVQIVRFEHAHLGYVADPFLHGVVVNDPSIQVETAVEVDDETAWWTLQFGDLLRKFDLEDHLGDQAWEEVWLHLERRRKGERRGRRWFDVAGVLVPGVYAEYRHLDDDWDELYLSSVSRDVDTHARLEDLVAGAGTYGGGEFDVVTIINSQVLNDRA